MSDTLYNIVGQVFNALQAAREDHPDPGPVWGPILDTYTKEIERALHVHDSRSTNALLEDLRGTLSALADVGAGEVGPDLVGDSLVTQDAPWGRQVAREWQDLRRLFDAPVTVRAEYGGGQHPDEIWMDGGEDVPGRMLCPGSRLHANGAPGGDIDPSLAIAFGWGPGMAGEDPASYEPARWAMGGPLGRHVAAHGADSFRFVEGPARPQYFGCVRGLRTTDGDSIVEVETTDGTRLEFTYRYIDEEGIHRIAPVPSLPSINPNYD